jgi:hypothetical protein
METKISATQMLESITSELLKGGWAGLAWACLRRSAEYQRGCKRLAADRTTKRRLCRQFGLRRPKGHEERYWEGKAPEFEPVRIVSPAAVTAESLHDLSRQTLLIRQSQVAVVLSRDQSITQQLRLVEQALGKSSQTSLRPAAKLRSLDEMRELAAPALLAYTIATRLGWGPTRIGLFLFPKRPRAAAKIKARDLVVRGRQYTERGYLTFAMQHLVETSSTRRTKRRATALGVKDVDAGSDIRRERPLTIMPMR